MLTTLYRCCRSAPLSFEVTPLLQLLAGGPPGTPPARSYMYGRYQRPIILEKGSTLSQDDERNFCPVSPSFKWEHTGANFDPVVSKFAALMLHGGKREIARNILRNTFAEIKFIQLKAYNKAKTDEEREKIELNPITILNQAVKNCTPVLFTQNVARGGIIYKVPFPPRSDADAQHRAVRFLLEVANNKPDHERIWVSLARELISASRNEGKSVRKKQDLHKICEENRAYANYRLL